MNKSSRTPATLGACALAACAAISAGEPGANRSTPRFTDPTAITNRFLPLSGLRQDVLQGREGKETIRIQRTMLPETKSFHVGGKTVGTVVMEDREFAGGRLVEVAKDYFAQADDGTVYYMGEDVDEYRNGKIVGHGGAWLTGKSKAVPGVLITSNPKVGDKWQSEAVPGGPREYDEVVSTTAAIKVPYGKFSNCIKVRETVPGEKPEYKLYAAGIGVVSEQPAGGRVDLVRHVRALRNEPHGTTR